MAQTEPINDDVDLPMQHAAPNQGTLTQLVVWIIALVLVLVALMTAFTGQWPAFWLAVVFGGGWFVGWLAKVALDSFVNSVK